MALHDLLADGQSQTRARSAPRQVFLLMDRHELREHAVELVPRDADARVPHGHARAIALRGLRDRHVDAAPRGGELQGVGDQVGHHPAQGLGSTLRRGTPG